MQLCVCGEKTYDDERQVKMITHASLFSGLGGFDLAAEMVGWTNLFNCEKDEWCRLLLKQHFQNTKNYGDIFKLNATQYRGRIEVLSGGFPCQPFSTSGLRKGADDERYLFPEMLRVIRECQPPWVVAENVRGILTQQTSSEVAALLGAEGYEVWVALLPASAVGAWHERYRTFFLCYSQRFKQQRTQRRQSGPIFTDGYSATQHADRLRQLQPPQTRHKKRNWYRHASFAHPNAISKRLEGQAHKTRQSSWDFVHDYPNRWQEEWPSAATRLCRMGYGVPDRMERIKALGNAVVVPLVKEIFEHINTIETNG